MNTENNAKMSISELEMTEVEVETNNTNTVDTDKRVDISEVKGNTEEDIWFPFFCLVVYWKQWKTRCRWR